MSQQSQTTDATEVGLQPNTWDFPGELPGNSIDSLALPITCAPQSNILLLVLLYHQYAFMLISLHICNMSCQIINHERDEIMNLKFLSTRAEEIQTAKRHRALAGQVRRPVPTPSPLVRPWTRKKTDHHRRLVLSYLQDGRTGWFGTLSKGMNWFSSIFILDALNDLFNFSFFQEYPSLCPLHRIIIHHS